MCAGSSSGSAGLQAVPPVPQIYEASTMASAKLRTRPRVASMVRTGDRAMDTVGGIGDASGTDERSAGTGDHAGIEAPPVIGPNERRMHVRAYNMWVAMLHGRPLPYAAELDPANAGDFAANGVLLDYGSDAQDPRVAWLGDALRIEGGMAQAPRSIAGVPAGSLVSRLSDQCTQILANRAPIGFEAEFVNVRGNTALYRGILMPFTSDGDVIDYIYGVINWKELADPQTAADIVAAARVALADVPVLAPVAPIAPAWADGPSRRGLGDAADGAPAEAGDATLADRLADVREAGTAFHAAEFRARGALYRALGTAYDLAFAADADPAGYAALLLRAGLRAQPRSPWLPIVRLVFGDGVGRVRSAEYAAVLAHAWRYDVAPGGMRGFLEDGADGIRGIVAAERAFRKAAG